MPALHTSLPVAPARASGPRPPVADGRARRRRALLRLAERHGEVRVVVRKGGRPAPQAVELLELLDELNESARLRWGGVQSRGEVAEAVYLRHAA